jgi:hypothetical protein
MFQGRLKTDPLAKRTRCTNLLLTVTPSHNRAKDSKAWHIASLSSELAEKLQTNDARFTSGQYT